MKRYFYTGLLLLLATSLFGRTTNGAKDAPLKSDATRETISLTRALDAHHNMNNTLQVTTRDSEVIFSEDFEGDVSQWSLNGQWSLTDLDSYSPTHSMVADDDPAGAAVSDLISPSIVMPAVTDIEDLSFNFAVFCDFPDFDGDGNNNLEDYYSVKIADLTAIPWHRSTTNAYEGGTSWWCGDEGIGGYSDDWLQFLDTDPIQLPAGSSALQFNLKYALEEYTGAAQTIDGCLINGWDAANVRISADGGSTWSPLTGTPAYTFSSAYGFSANNDGCSVPGWGGISAGWGAGNFDLSAYAGEEVIIRFALGSDVSYSTADDATITGFYVDNVLVSNAGDTLFFNDAETEGNMTASGVLWNDVFYDYGDVSRPGGAAWGVYESGMEFNGSLDLTAYAGKTIKLKWMSRVDGDDDGGNGTGLHIDDVSIFKSTQLVVPPPSNVAAEVVSGSVMLTWDDMNNPQAVDFFYGDDSYESFIAGSPPWTVGRVVGSGWAQRFDAALPTNLENFYYLLSSGNTANPGQLAPIQVTVWDGDENILYQSAPVTPAAMDEFQVFDLTPADLTVQGSFYIGWCHTDTLYPFPALDSDSEYMGEMYGYTPLSGGAIVSLTGSGLDGNYALFADGTTSSTGGITYNVYRRTENGTFSAPLNATPLTAGTYTDETVENGVGYYYAVKAYYQGVESGYSTEVFAMPEAASVIEMTYDDGTAETGYNSSVGNYLAVKFTPSAYPVLMKRIRFYVNDPAAAGNTIAYVWQGEGDGAPPVDVNTYLFRSAISGLTYGWNQLDITSDSIWVTNGSFYVGWKIYSSTPSLGADNSGYQGNSFVYGSGTWINMSEAGLNYNLMIHAVVDTAWVVVGIDQRDNQIPTEFALAQNYPNPFNPTTNIDYSVPNSGPVNLTVYDMNGRVVSELVNKTQSAGNYRVTVDGSSIASGVYFYRLTSGTQSMTKKMTLVK